MARGFRREARVNDLIQTALARILQKEAADVVIGLVTITGVSVSHDLAFAKIFVSVLPEESAREAIAALNAETKELRHLLARAVRLRIVPDLKFVFDESIARGSRISSLIHDVLKDDKG